RSRPQARASPWTLSPLSLSSTSFSGTLGRKRPGQRRATSLGTPRRRRAPSSSGPRATASISRPDTLLALLIGFAIRQSVPQGGGRYHARPAAERPRLASRRTSVGGGGETRAGHPRRRAGPRSEQRAVRAHV